MQPTLGEIRLVGFTYAPVGWLFCQGQVLPIAGYEALFMLLGTTYGGDGSSTFALPNLQSLVVAGTGAGAGRSPYALGQMAGTEAVALTTPNLPSHQHSFAAPLSAASGGPAQNSPFGAAPGPSGGGNIYAATPDAGAQLATTAVTGTTQPYGGTAAHSNIQPVLALNYVIAVEGIFPS